MQLLTEVQGPRFMIPNLLPLRLYEVYMYHVRFILGLEETQLCQVRIHEGPRPGSRKWLVYFYGFHALSQMVWSNGRLADLPDWAGAATKNKEPVAVGYLRCHEDQGFGLQVDGSPHCICLKKSRLSKCMAPQQQSLDRWFRSLEIHWIHWIASWNHPGVLL